MAWPEASIQHHSSTTVEPLKLNVVYTHWYTPSFWKDVLPQLQYLDPHEISQPTFLQLLHVHFDKQHAMVAIGAVREDGWEEGGRSDFHLCLTGSYMPFNKLHVWEIVDSKLTVWHFTAGSTSGREARYWRMSVCPSEAAMCTGCSSPCMRY